MNIAFITTELAPFAKVGGLGDVSSSLPLALSKLGCNVKIFLPRYSIIDPWRYELHYCYNLNEISIKISEKELSFHTYKLKLPNSDIEVYFIDNNHYFGRENIYTNDHDEAERFIFFTKAVFEICQRLKWAPDIFHLNDWPSGFFPIILKSHYAWDSLFSHSTFLFTIHNIEYQGNFPPDIIWKNQLDGKYFYPGGPLEFHNKTSFLKAGILFSQIITTVSETYAKEILTHEYGAGMEKVLETRKDDLFGILNGVDYSEWNPSSDRFIPYKYSQKSLYRKKKNKLELLKYFHLPEDLETPLIGIVSRLVSQKGFDLLIQGWEKLFENNIRMVVLGAGEKKYEDFFKALCYSFPQKVAVKIGFSTELAHLIEAGADMFLMPSRYEPCGLNQIYSLKYGTVPIVRKTGGLADTVKDWDYYSSLGLNIGNGFSFDEFSSDQLIDAVQRAINRYFEKDTWKKIQINGMNADFSWEQSAKKYFDLYLLAKKKKIST